MRDLLRRPALVLLLRSRPDPLQPIPSKVCTTTKAEALSPVVLGGEGRPHILAQVTSTGALPLTYVIPFQIEKGHGAFGASLVVRKMRQLQGECLRAHPNCFSEPYTLKGVYGHISKLELSLQRRFTHAGKAASFLSADCPAPGHQSLASPQFGVSLRYALGSSLGGESANPAGPVQGRKLKHETNSEGAL